MNPQNELDGILVRTIDPLTKKYVIGVLHIDLHNTWVNISVPIYRKGERLDISPGCWEYWSKYYDSKNMPIFEHDIVEVVLPQPFDKINGVVCKYDDEITGDGSYKIMFNAPDYEDWFISWDISKYPFKTHDGNPLYSIKLGSKLIKNLQMVGVSCKVVE